MKPQGNHPSQTTGSGGGSSNPPPPMILSPQDRSLSAQSQAVGSVQISALFNTKGPIRPQFLVGVGSSAPEDNSQNQGGGASRQMIPQARDFIKQNAVLSPQFISGQQRHSPNAPLSQEEYYGEEDYGEEEKIVSARGMRQFSAEEERQILATLMEAGSRNHEFSKVMSILQNDLELRPLIFEHEILLRALTGMNDLKAEYMLSILTAAETEMFENPRSRDNPELNERCEKLQAERDHFFNIGREVAEEAQKLKTLIDTLNSENSELKKAVEAERKRYEELEKEKECTFKNLFDEIQQLKKQAEGHKKLDHDSRMKEQEFKEEIQNLRKRLKTQEDLRLNLMNEKDRIEMELQGLKERFSKEVQQLEKENENLHRKMNSTFNSALLQNQLQNQLLTGGKLDDEHRDLSLSFQGSRIGEDKGAGIYYGNTTQNLRLLLSGERSCNNSAVGKQQAGIVPTEDVTNPFSHIKKPSESMMRSNSIEVLLLDKQGQKKQSRLAFQEDSESSEAAVPHEANKRYVSSKGFLDLRNAQPRSGSQLSKETSGEQIRLQEQQIRQLSRENQQLKAEVRALQVQDTRGLKRSPGSSSRISMGETPRIGIENSGRGMQQQQHHQLVTQVPNVRSDLVSSSGSVQNYPNQLEHQRPLSHPRHSHQTSAGSVHLSQIFAGRPGDHSADRERHYAQNQQHHVDQMDAEYKIRIQEIGVWLVNLYKRFQPSHLDLARYSSIHDFFTLDRIRELINEISVRADQIVEMVHQQSIKPSTFYNQQNQSLATINASIAQPGITSSPLGFYPQQNNYFQPTGPQQQKQQAISTDVLLDLKSQLLQEKERRLQAQEDLQDNRGRLTETLHECDRLKRELAQYGVQWDLMSKRQQQLQASGMVDEREVHRLMGEYEAVKDENVAMQLRVAELEGMLMEERQGKEVRFDMTIKDYKANMQGQYLDYKLKADELIMIEKEKNNKLRLEVGRYQEDIQQLRKQLTSSLIRIESLEKENFDLHNELDRQEIPKAVNQIISNRESSVRSKTPDPSERLLKRMEDRNRQLTRQVANAETQLRRERDNQVLYKMQLENEIAKLKTDNEALISQLRIMAASTKMGNTSISSGAQEATSVKHYQKQVAALKLQSVLVLADLRAKVQTLLRLATFQREKHSRISKNDSALSISTVNLDSKHQQDKIAQLDDQVITLQNQNTILLAQIGKILRNVNSQRQIKLSLSGMVSSYNLDYILSGFKGNSEVLELNLSNCGLVDQDLVKIVETLKSDSYMVNLRLQKNQFTSVQPLIELFNHQVTKGGHIQDLDISNIPLDFNHLDSFVYVLDGLSSLQQLSLAYCFTQATLGPHGKQQTIDKVDGLLNKLFSLNSLRALDLSKNRFYPESLATLFTLLAKSKTIKALALSSVDGFNDDAAKVLVEALASNDHLKQLNIAGNKLSPQSVTQILQAIARNGAIADLDMSKCNFDGRFKELAEVISLNKQLRSLSVQKVAMNSIQGAVLIQPIVESLNLEVLKFDFNHLSGEFLEKLCSKMILNPVQNQRQLNFQHNITQSENSIITDDSVILDVPKPGSPSMQGVTHLSFEGNTQLGDRGAKALADLIRKPNNNSKQLSMINLNECGITNEGFEELRNALLQRGNLAQVASLSHVKIKIERNQISNF